MKYARISIVILALLLPGALAANAGHIGTITGTVYTLNEHGTREKAPGAMVAAPGTLFGTPTDNEGHFTIDLPDSISFLVVSFAGYLADTLHIKAGTSDYIVELALPHTLGEVVVREQIKSTEIGLLGLTKTENIGQQELMKAACCNLGESFETTPSVDVSYTDAVTGYKQVRMLGLAGPYTLITQENIPEVRGLAAITGLTYMPGPWIESMQLSKGSGSVVNGFESVAGQINVELKKPFAGEQWLFNLYQSSQGKSEGNVLYRHKVTRNLGTNLMVHASSQYLKLDQNNDHFLDQPLGNQIDILNRWIYNDPKGWMLQAGIKYLYAHGTGGQWNYAAGDLQAPGSPWGYTNTTTRLEDWVKVARIFQARPATSFGLQLSNVNYSQDATYGARSYNGLGHSFYANLIFQTYLGNTSHVIKAGASTLVDLYDETFAQIAYNRTEYVPGIFAEYAWHCSDKWDVEAGLRGDYHNLYGAFATPRLHVRYAPFRRTVVRASVGRAERTANIFAENMGFMASSRQFNIVQPEQGKAYGLNPEIAWNTGVNLTHKFRIGLREAVFGLDYYYTWFQQQVVVDLNDPGFLSFYNLSGRSFAHSFSLQFDYELLHHFNIRLAYRYYNVMTTYTGVLQQKPLVPANRAFMNLDYATRSKWKFDYTIQGVGTQRTPGVTHNHTGLDPGGVNQSPAYLAMNMQVSKTLSEILDVYAGCENPFNYMQHDAIIAAGDPFGPKFDASLIWGPMMGRNIYAGVRYKVKERIKKEQ